MARKEKQKTGRQQEFNVSSTLDSKVMQDDAEAAFALTFLIACTLNRRENAKNSCFYLKQLPFT